MMTSKFFFQILVVVSFSAQAEPQLSHSIKPGVLVRATTDTDWNTPLLSAFGELVSGGLDQVTEIVRENSRIFGFAMMASLRPSQLGIIEIADFGVSITMRNQHGEPVAVSASVSTQEVQSLGFISRMVLRANEEALQRIKIIARHPQSILIEAPTIKYSAGKNIEVLVRYLLFLDRKSRPHLFVYGPISTGRSAPPKPIFRALRTGMDEIRRFYVDASQFTFGVPSKSAFGLIDLPPGKDWDNAAASELFGSDPCASRCLQQLVELLSPAGSSPG